MDEIRDYIDRAKSAQQAHDERPGTQLAFADPADEMAVTELWEYEHPNHDDDPGDCTDHKGA